MQPKKYAHRPQCFVFVVVRHRSFLPQSFTIIPWYWERMISLETTMKNMDKRQQTKPWKIWINDNKQSATKLCAYFMRNTVIPGRIFVITVIGHHAQSIPISALQLSLLWHDTWILIDFKGLISPSSMSEKLTHGNQKPFSIYGWVSSQTMIRGFTNVKYLLLFLTHWGQEKMAAIFQITFSNGLSRMKMYAFWSKFHCSLIQGST